MAEKKLKYSYKPPKTKTVKRPAVKLQKLPVKQQIVRRHHHRVQQEGDRLTREEKYASLVIIVAFILALYYLFTQ
ncbi:MAG TPA: hypothetical protein VJI12_03525 [archaeon]|nr:hypothetical protein [archaeon]